VTEALRRYLQDAERGDFPLHLASVDDRMPPDPVPDL